MQNQPAWLQEDGSMEAPGPANGDAAASPAPQPNHERQVRAVSTRQGLRLQSYLWVCNGYAKVWLLHRSPVAQQISSAWMVPRARQCRTPMAMARMLRHRQAPARSRLLRSLLLHGTRWRTCWHCPARSLHSSPRQV